MTKETNPIAQAKRFKASRATWFTQNYGDVDDRTRGRISKGLDVREQLDADLLKGDARKQAMKKLFTLARSVAEVKKMPIAGQVLFNKLAERPDAPPVIISPTPGVTADTVHLYSPGIRRIEHDIKQAEADLKTLKARQVNRRKPLPAADSQGIYPIADVLREFGRGNS